MENPDSTTVYNKLIATVSTTMTDQGATMPQFHDKLKLMREEILPVAVENWEDLPQNVKETTIEFGRFFCKMHPIINFADEVNKTLKTYEDLATSGKNKHAIISSEAGVTKTGAFYFICIYRLTPRNYDVSKDSCVRMNCS